MAKDGTARGSNIKVNAGRRSKGLAEKIAAALQKPECKAEELLMKTYFIRSEAVK